MNDIIIDFIEHAIIEIDFIETPSIEILFNNSQWLAWPPWKSSYEIYLDNWWTLSEQEWLAYIEWNLTIIWNVNRDFSIDFENIFLS